MATPNSANSTNVRRVNKSGDIEGSGNEGLGVRPIIIMPSNFSPQIVEGAETAEEDKLET